MNSVLMSSTSVRSKLQVAIGLFFGLSILNFALMMVVIRIQGGGALNGKVENGRYYLGEAGRYTEVTQSVYTSGRTYETISVVTFLVTIVTGIAYSALKPSAKGNTTGSIATGRETHSDSS